VANGAGLDVRARPASKVVGGDRGHVSRMQDPGCSGLGDDLKTAWTLSGHAHADRPKPTGSPLDRPVKYRAGP
jgi:hypothetical protein